MCSFIVVGELGREHLQAKVSTIAFDLMASMPFAAAAPVSG